MQEKMANKTFVFYILLTFCLFHSELVNDIHWKLEEKKMELIHDKKGTQPCACCATVRLVAEAFHIDMVRISRLQCIISVCLPEHTAIQNLPGHSSR